MAESSDRFEVGSTGGVQGSRASSPSQGDGLVRRRRAHLEASTGARVPENVPSLPWTWTGGYPQRITCPDATLIAEVYENPDVPAVIAPLICDAVNAYFGVEGSLTYDEQI